MKVDILPMKVDILAIDILPWYLTFEGRNLTYEWIEFVTYFTVHSNTNN